ncbi:MAG TPA: hypothetical protein VGC06_22285 [Actinomycetes bacterium]
MRDDDASSSSWAIPPLANRRRVRKDHSIDHVPAELRERIAATAERLAHTFEVSARTRERMAEQGGPWAEHHLLQAARHRTLADFERQQAQALRAGHLLAGPWHPGVNSQEPGRPAL